MKVHIVLIRDGRYIALVIRDARYTALVNSAVFQRDAYVYVRAVEKVGSWDTE